MRTITHRELRNESARILREVSAGEIIEVTNHGEVAAVLVPPSMSRLDRLTAAGKVRPATGAVVDLRRVQRSRSSSTTAALLAELRGDR